MSGKKRIKLSESVTIILSKYKKALPTQRRIDKKILGKYFCIYLFSIFSRTQREMVKKNKKHEKRHQNYIVHKIN